MKIGDRVVVDALISNLKFSGTIYGIVSGVEEELFVVQPDGEFCGYLVRDSNHRAGYISKVVVHKDNMIKESSLVFS